MTLTVLEVQKAKPKEKPYKLGDSGGLYLLVTPSGGKCWRFKYRYAGREKVLALGTFPEITLAEAREQRDDARKLKARSIDPSEIKKEQKQQLLEVYENNFENIAREWHELKKGKWSAYYSRQVMQRLENDVFPKIGTRPISKLTAPDILRVAKAIEARDALEIAHRTIQYCGQVFQYAIITGRTLHNPAAALRGALKTPQTKNHNHLSASELPEFLGKLEDYDGSTQTRLAMKLLILTFVRTGELCGAKWEEIDFNKAEWRIPAQRMKMKSPHVVPLSPQALSLLHILKRLAGKWEHVFPGVQSPRNHMSTNTMLYVLYTLGYKDRATMHGFRATSSTILNESGLFGRDTIERQLAHQERNRVRAAYNHAEYLPERRKMMEWWGNYLEEAGLKSSA